MSPCQTKWIVPLLGRLLTRKAAMSFLVSQEPAPHPCARLDYVPSQKQTYRVLFCSGESVCLQIRLRWLPRGKYFPSRSGMMVMRYKGGVLVGGCKVLNNLAASNRSVRHRTEGRRMLSSMMMLTTMENWEKKLN